MLLVFLVLAAVAAHLLLVLHVVAADAEDAADRELVGGALDLERGRGPQGKGVGHVVLSRERVGF